MYSGNERSFAEPSTGTTTWERQGETSEPMRWRHTNGELSSFDRLELLGWDEA
jgi:hypothetical protein